MKPIQEGDLLWQPTEEIIENANITHYMRWLAENYDAQVDNYDALWRWSVTYIDRFWLSITEYFDIQFMKKSDTVLSENTMPDVKWFDGAELNYTHNIFHKRNDTQPMMIVRAEDQPSYEMTWQDAYGQVNRLATTLRKLGVKKGDRVVNFMPNRPETIIALLATASIGAIWSSCSPDFGATSVLDRFTQIEPKVLFAVDGYRYGGKDFDRRDVLIELQEKLPSVEHTILVPHIADNTDRLKNTSLWSEALANVTPPEQLQFEPVEFSHPLWILYSSGTTGLPKPIVHSHGGIILEHVKTLNLHHDLRSGDRFFWYTSTGWMMWNYLVGALFSGASIIVYDGSPAYPNINELWQLASESGMSYFGTSAAFISACIKAEIHPNQDYDLSKIRGLGSTGSPLTISGFQWVYENVNDRLALSSLSGGTDVCTAFVGGVITKSIYAGEIQGASLGSKVVAYDDNGHSVVDEVGELVITEPMPSMPIYFWNDPDKQRYKSAYFEMYNGIWRHGDWIKFNERGGCIIYGRSDSTINRQGIRMGTSEIYQVVEALDEIMDSLIIDLELLGRESYMPLFVVLREGVVLDDELKQRIKQTIRENVSPRHAPNEIFEIEEVPYTLSGKKLEVPIRKILLGYDIQKASNPGAMRNPHVLDYFIGFAKKLEARRG
jgi:acetoacetyl-CoA synthetase